MVRRISRTPAMLSVSEQEALVRMGERDEDLRRDLETLLDVKWDNMTFGEKVTAVHDFLESGRSLMTVAVAAQARAMVANLAASKRGEIPLAERAELLEEANHLLREQVTRLRGELAEFRARAVAAGAGPAMAVHSQQGEH